MFKIEDFSNLAPAYNFLGNVIFFHVPMHIFIKAKQNIIKRGASNEN